MRTDKVSYRLQTRWAVVASIEKLQRRKRELQLGRSKAKAGNWRLGKRDT